MRYCGVFFKFRVSFCLFYCEIHIFTVLGAVHLAATIFARGHHTVSLILYSIAANCTIGKLAIIDITIGWKSDIYNCHHPTYKNYCTNHKYLLWEYLACASPNCRKRCNFHVYRKQKWRYPSYCM